MLCDDEFYLSATNTCLACGTGALKCTDDKIAKECKPKFFLKTDDNTCSPCGSNALTCTDLTHAKSCETGYFKSTDTCT